MKYALLIYEDEAIYGPGKSGPKIEEIVGKHMAFAQELGTRREEHGIGDDHTHERRQEDGP